MARPLRSLLLLLGLAACSGQGQLAIVLLNFPEGTRRLDLSDSPTYRSQWNYRLRIESRVRKAVHVQVRLGEGATEGVSATLLGEVDLLPVGSGIATLVIAPPRALGPFSGTVEFFAEELPDWRFRLEFAGEVVEKPREGRILTLDPAVVDLGTVRPGEAKPFVLAVRNAGTEPITISRWRIHDTTRVALFALRGGEVIGPGEFIRVDGTVTAPRSGKRVFERISVHSNAENAPVRDIVVRGNILTPYEIVPERLHWGQSFAAQAPEVRVVLRATEDAAPFTVASVEELEPFFEIVEKGSAEPAPEQQVLLRLRKDAPVGPVEVTARFHLEPGSVVLDWPVSLRVVPAIYAQPDEVNFGRVDRASPPRAEIRLMSFVGREFEVTSARSEKGYFAVDVEHAQGLPWVVLVHLPSEIRPGIYRDRILVETTDPDTPGIHIPVYAEIVR